MHYLITGGTGLIGSKIGAQLLSAGHHVTVLSRSKSKVEKQCARGTKAIVSLVEIADTEKVDCIINLAGAPIADKRWSDSRKRILEESRINITNDLINWIHSRKDKPDALISGSAVGWYGSRGDEILTEKADYSDDYAHNLCHQWEQAAMEAKSMGVRVCLVRTGLVLAKKGGFLQRMTLPFKLCLGAAIGNGEQFMPWIHINDISELFIFLSQKQHLSGVFNGSAPNPVNNNTFTYTLADVLNRPAIFRAPASFIRLALGEMSTLLLEGQRVVPAKAMTAGFEFQYTELKPSLINIYH